MERDEQEPRAAADRSAKLRAFFARFVAARGGALDIRVSDERAKLLETGGGVVNALPLIDADPFFIVNADNMWIDGSADTLRLLAQRWNASQMDALLLLVPLARATGYDGRGDFHLAPDGVVAPRGEVRVAPFVYSGIQLISKHLFDGEPAAEAGPKLLLVAACALVDTDGRVLLTRRPEGKAMAGLWEFPGGKMLPGEPPEGVNDYQIHPLEPLSARFSVSATF